MCLRGHFVRRSGRRYHASTALHDLIASPLRLSTDKVENEIDSGEDLAELLLPVVHDLIGAQRPHQIDTVSGSRGRHARTGLFRELHRECADAAGGRVDEYGFASLEMADREQAMLGRACGSRYGSPLGRRDWGWEGNALRRRHGGIFRKATARQRIGPFDHSIARLDRRKRQSAYATAL